MGNNRFDLDLRHGQAVEGALAELLLRATIEVKDDMRSRTTGNMCIEFEQRGPAGPVPSGIAVTKAMYWAARFDEDSYIIIPTEQLKKIAREFFRDPARVKITGDNGNRSVLVPLTAIFPAMRLVPAK